MKRIILPILAGMAIMLFMNPAHCQNNDASANDSLKVISFNLYGAPNSQWSTRIQMILEELSGIQPDLIGLQEVVETPGYDGSDNSGRELADSLFYRTGLHYDYVFAPTHFAWGQYDEGIAILSRHIITNTRAFNLPSGIFNRKLLWARVLTPGGIVNFYVTHLAYGDQEHVRISQVNAIKALIDSISSVSPAAADILCGDFNAIPNSSPIKLLTDPDAPEIPYIDTWAVTNPGQPGYTIPSDNPSSRIDYIFLRQNDSCLALSSNRVFMNPANGIYPSDHIGVFSTFQTTFAGMKIDILTPAAGDEVSGQTLISWSVTSPATPRTFTIFISNDNGRTWWQEWSGQSVDYSYLWNTISRPDGVRYLIRIIAMGENIYEMGQTTGVFTVNNPGNVAPEVELISPRGGETISGAHPIRWFAGDADGDSLQQTLDVSMDNGSTWQQLASFRTVVTSFPWNTKAVANSPNYRLRIRCSDGVHETTSASGRFTVYNEPMLLPGASVYHVAGNSDAIVKVHLIDPAQLTGDRYRITFDDTLFEHKVYHVQNMTTGAKPVQNAHELDGVTEGPLFDGLRLLIKDFEAAEVHHDSSGWRIGASNLEIKIYVPSLYFGADVIEGTAYPADYQITIYDHVVDTSDSFLGAPEQPMMFTLWNLTGGRKSHLIFNDQDNNYAISKLDEIFILEPDREGNLQLTWSLFFGGPTTVSLPQPGDVFIFKTKKPLTSKDIYEFPAITGIRDDKTNYPSAFELKGNYPNPFNAITTIRYTLIGSAHVSLKIYNLLGQEIKTLVDKTQDTGYHQVAWDGKNNSGSRISTGIYFYRLETDGMIQLRKLLLLR